MENSTTATGNVNYSYIQTKVINLGEDGHYFALYKAHPYFVDVLEWLEGIRPFTAIRHNYSSDEFRENVLPDVLCALKREKLVKGVYGQLKPVYGDVLVKNMPRDPILRCEVIAAQLDILLRRAFEDMQTLKLDIVRTKASPDQIRDWRRQLIHIFEEIEDHDDPDGVPFVLNMVSLKETA